MKNWKIYSIVITILLGLIIISFGIYVFVFKETFSLDEAKDIAYNYAKVNSADVTVISVQKDREDREYEIHFYDNTYEYEVDVNYNNGRVGNFEKDLRDNVNINSDSNITMSEDEAKDIALKKVGKVQDEVTFTKVLINRDNGATVYDVYFYDFEKEYEISIDVETKEIISYKEDYLNNTNQITTTDKYIGAEKAREIVLNHAGFNINNVTFKKLELDVDYGIATYEIEFYYNYYEYDYEVNAVTGEIIKYEKDR